MSYKVLDEFYDNVIKTQPNSWRKEFSKIFVLVANNNSPTRPYERHWKDILWQFIEKYQYLIVGWMCFESNMTSDEYEFISYIDTRVPGEGIAYFMMHSYYIRFDKMPLPFEIIENAVIYWKMYFVELELYDLDEIHEMENNYSVKWKYLKHLLINDGI
jgi:hypothetical protein